MNNKNLDHRVVAASPSVERDPKSYFCIWIAGQIPICGFATYATAEAYRQQRATNGTVCWFDGVQYINLDDIAEGMAS